MLELLVILQTHATKNRDTTQKRFCGAEKSEVSRRCVSSLVDSLNYAQRLLPDFKITLKIFDDHSGEEFLKTLNTIILKADFSYSITSLDSHGIMPSILACYKHGKEHGKDLVYFVQDDYLYEKSAIKDMVSTAAEASRDLKSPVSIFPFNDPYYYAPVNTAIKSHIVRAHGRHWRTNILTPSCFMTHADIIRKNWDVFHGMGTAEVSPTMEDDTINQLWRYRGFHLLIPIPSLAFHMQFDSEKDDLADWRPLWDSYARSNYSYEFSPNQKYLINIGSGNESIVSKDDYSEFAHLHEIKVDIALGFNTDIVDNLLSLSKISDEVADVVYLSHVLEHLDPWETNFAIKNMLRITKKAGLIRIRVPNLKSISKYLATGRVHQPIYDSSAGPVSPLDMIYGHGHSIMAQGNPMRHKTGFTKEKFQDIAKELRLNLKIKEADYELIVDIIK